MHVTGSDTSCQWVRAPRERPSERHAPEAPQRSQRRRRRNPTPRADGGPAARAGEARGGPLGGRPGRDRGAARRREAEHRPVRRCARAEAVGGVRAPRLDGRAARALARPLPAPVRAAAGGVRAGAAGGGAPDEARGRLLLVADAPGGRRRDGGRAAGGRAGGRRRAGRAQDDVGPGEGAAVEGVGDRTRDDARLLRPRRRSCPSTWWWWAPRRRW